MEVARNKLDVEKPRDERMKKVRVRIVYILSSYALIQINFISHSTNCTYR